VSVGKTSDQLGVEEFKVVQILLNGFRVLGIDLNICRTRYEKKGECKGTKEHIKEWKEEEVERHYDQSDIKRNVEESENEVHRWDSRSGWIVS
jgi:hypothetical protein